MAGSIGPVFSDATDRVWFAPASGGLYWFRDGRVGAVAALRDDVIYSIAGDADAVLVGRQRGGMTRVRAHGDTVVTFTTETFTERDGLAQNQVFAVHRARDGAVWAGTIGRGASRLKDGAFTTYTTKDGLASNTVAAVLETADGAMWFATPNGVSVKSPEGWRRYSTADGLPSNDVNTLFEDSARNVWVGTAAGLAVMHEGRMQSLPGVPALLRASVLGLAEDRAGGLWIAATGHVLRVDREKLLRGTLGAGDLREFSAADGLLDTEAIKRHRILTADSRGRVWLSTDGGLVMADSRRVAAGIAPALVQVEEVSGRWPDPVERADGARQAKTRRGDDDPAAARPHHVRVCRLESVRAGSRALSLSPRWIRSRLERAGGRAAGRVHQPRSRHLSISGDRVQQRRRLEQRRGGATVHDRAGVVADGIVLGRHRPAGGRRHLGRLSHAPPAARAATRRPLRRASRRALAHRARAARYAAAKLSRRAAALSRRDLHAAGSTRGRARDARERHRSGASGDRRGPRRRAGAAFVRDGDQRHRRGDRHAGGNAVHR